MSDSVTEVAAQQDTIELPTSARHWLVYLHVGKQLGTPRLVTAETAREAAGDFYGYAVVTPCEAFGELPTSAS